MSVRPFFLAVDDDSPGETSTEAVLRGFRCMTDLKNGSEQLPTVVSPWRPGDVALKKSKTPDTHPRQWRIVATPTGFYIWVQHERQGGLTTYRFGEIYPMLGSVELRRMIEKINMSDPADGIASRPNIGL
jgi:hypothetical protein